MNWFVWKCLSEYSIATKDCASWDFLHSHLKLLLIWCSAHAIVSSQCGTHFIFLAWSFDLSAKLLWSCQDVHMHLYISRVWWRSSCHKSDILFNVQVVHSLLKGQANSLFGDFPIYVVLLLIVVLILGCNKTYRVSDTPVLPVLCNLILNFIWLWGQKKKYGHDI